MVVGSTSQPTSFRSGDASLSNSTCLPASSVPTKLSPVTFPPGLAKDNYTNPAVVKWREKVEEADGFIIVTPEYNHGYPAVLKNALDYVYYKWAKKAVAFVSWGGAGGARGVEQLRLVAIELDMCPTRAAVHIPNPWFIKDISEIDTDANKQSAGVLLDQLTWWTRALKTARVEFSERFGREARP